MAQIVDVPGVGEVEFPDGMGDAEIIAALRKIAPPKPTVGKPESAVRGALQGASMGFGDEAAAAVESVLPDFMRNEVSRQAVGDAQTVGDRYRAAREFYRHRNAEAQASNPGTYLASQVAGAVAPTLVGAAPATGARALGLAAGQGAVQGVGYSDADSVSGLVGDAALGAALGTAGYGTGTLLGKGASALGRAASNRLGLASARAGAQAAGEVAEQTASAAGKLGAETQKGSRYVENLMRLEQSMTPQQKALYQQLQASGVVPSLQQSVAQGTLEALPSQAGTIAARQAELAALQRSAPQAVAGRTAELLKPTVKADTLSYLKSYAEPVAWAVGAQQAADAAGLDPGQQGALATAAGILGGRTRAGKALWNRINRPGNQTSIASGQDALARLLAAMQRPVASAAPAALIPALVDEP